MGPETRHDVPTEEQPHTPPTTGPDSQAVREASGRDAIARLFTGTCEGPERTGVGHDWDEDADWDWDLVDHGNGD